MLNQDLVTSGECRSADTRLGSGTEYDVSGTWKIRARAFVSAATVFEYKNLVHREGPALPLQGQDVFDLLIDGCFAVRRCTTAADGPQTA